MDYAAELGMWAWVCVHWCGCGVQQKTKRTIFQTFLFLTQTPTGVTDDRDPLLLIVAWKLNVLHGKCWEFTRDEFVSGWSIQGYVLVGCVCFLLLVGACTSKQ